MDIIEDVKEYIKAGFNQNDWENPSTTNSLRANTNYHLDRYVEGGITKYLWYVGSFTQLATGFIVFSDSGNPSNYRWQFYQSGREKFDGSLPFPSNWNL